MFYFVTQMAAPQVVAMNRRQTLWQSTLLIERHSGISRASAKYIPINYCKIQKLASL